MSDVIKAAILQELLPTVTKIRYAERKLPNLTSSALSHSLCSPQLLVPASYCSTMVSSVPPRPVRARTPGVDYARLVLTLDQEVSACASIRLSVSGVFLTGIPDSAHLGTNFCLRIALHPCRILTTVTYRERLGH